MSCPANPPAPSGYAVWKGPVPPELSKWAVQLLGTVSKYDFGQTWTMVDAKGETIIARLDRHTWHYLPDGTLLTNLCWKGITLYRPLAIQTPYGGVTTNIETATPSADFAVYDTPPSSTNWTLVAVAGGAIVFTVAAFWAAIHFTGRSRLSVSSGAD
ncbi:MAG: hypothetical protein KGI71_04895 [Patescibacteria group bacterium]|nr:hypothetical protein [Patescibacteria group bacterium]